MKQLVVLLLICAGVSFPARAAQPATSSDTEKVVLQLKWQHQFQFAGYYAAIEQGYYREAGLEVELRERTIDQKRAVDLMLSGQADYAIDGSNVLISRIEGKPLVALAAIFQHSPAVAIGLKKNNYHTAQGMVGKRMTSYGADIEIPAMLLHEGIDPAKIEMVLSPLPIDALTSGEVDLSSVYLTNEPFILEQKGVPYTVINPINYGIDFYGDILVTSEKELMDHPLRAAAFRCASMKGWKYALAHSEEIVDLILAKYTQRKSREHLLYEARESIRLISPDVVEIGHLNPGRFAHMAEVLKALSLVQTTTGLDGFVYAERPLGQLSDEEYQWLQQRHRVRVFVTHAPPLVYIKGARIEGLLIDYLKRLSVEFGIDLEYVQGNWNEAVAGVTSRSGPDVIPLFSPDAQRRITMALSQPYISMPIVIFTREESGFVGAVEDLVGRKVSLHNGFLAQTVLTEKYSGIEVVPTATIQDAVRLLARGEVDAYIGSLMLISYTIKELGLENIKVAAPAEILVPEHVFASREDWPELVSLFNRMINSMSAAEHAAIRSRWLSMRFDYGIAHGDLLSWGLSVLAVVLIGFSCFGFWNRRLQREIRRRKQSEDALTKSVQQYQMLVHVLPHGIIEIDRTLDILYCNRPFAELIGCLPRELFGVSISSLFADKDSLATLSETFTTVRRLRKPQGLILALVDRQQQRHDVRFDLSFNPEMSDDRQIIIVTDLTHQGQIEKALRETESFYQQTFDHIQAGVLHLTAEGQITRVNPYFCDMLGYPETKLVQMTLEQITHPEDFSLSREVLDKLRAGESEPYSMAKRYLKRDGRSIWGLATASLQSFKEGSETFVVVVQNIDEFKVQQDHVADVAQNLESIIQQRTIELHQRIEEVEKLNFAMMNLADDLQRSNCDLALQQEQLAEANAELEAFAYSVSHDLRAPLRHVSGFVAILQDANSHKMEPADQALLEKIEAAAKRMGVMIDDLLTFSRAGRTELMLAPVDMNLLFKECSNTISSDYAELDIDWEIGDLPPIRGDVSTLRQVVINLLDNAAKYSSHNEQPRIQVEAQQLSDEIVFEIKDNGVGFDPAYKDKLFQVFQRLHRVDEFSGTGIGLASVRRIITRHGGWVKGDSRPGEGACFSFSIPAVNQEGEPGAKEL